MAAASSTPVDWSQGQQGSEQRVGGEPSVVARPAEFGKLNPAAPRSGNASMNSIMDVTVTVSAELGRLMLPIEELLKLSPGSVLELDRLVSDPVDVMVKGVKVASGEVVVVNDHFAVRIKEVAKPMSKSDPGNS